MRNCFVAAMLGSIFLVGCAEPKSAQFNVVPGPSQSALNLPPLAQPAPARNSAVTVEKLGHTSSEKPKSKPAPEIITPDMSLRGKVSRYNDAGRFVVMEFPIGHLPAVGQKLFIYRNDLKVGEVKVTGPQRDDRTVADLARGEAKQGDEVREK